MNWITDKYGWIFKLLRWVKDKHKSVHTARFYLQNIFENVNWSVVTENRLVAAWGQEWTTRSWGNFRGWQKCYVCWSWQLYGYIRLSSLIKLCTLNVFFKKAKTKNWKQLKWPPTREWINKLWHILIWNTAPR